MGLPWEYGPKQFDVQAGQSSLVQLNVPYRGTIRTFRLAAPGGSTGAFELYNSEAAARAAVAAGNGSSESAPTGIPASEYVIYSGELADGVKVDNDLRIPFVNRDGTPSVGDPRLWMRLTPDGSDVLTFVLSMVIEGVEL